MKFRTSIVTMGAALLSLAGVARAEWSANIGASNNYLWRGVTQTGDEAAVSGGVDYGHQSGFYAGLWASNVNFGSGGQEVDLYGGFAGEAGGIGYDIGYIYYAYPAYDSTTVGESDFQEVYVRGSIADFSLGIAFQIDAEFTDQDYIYIDATYDLAINDDYGLGFKIGHYDTDNDVLFGNGDSYTHFGIALSKGEFSLGIEKNDIDGGNADNPRVVISWGREF